MFNVSQFGIHANRSDNRRRQLISAARAALLRWHLRRIGDSSGQEPADLAQKAYITVATWKTLTPNSCA